MDSISDRIWKAAFDKLLKFGFKNVARDFKSYVMSQEKFIYVAEDNETKMATRLMDYVDEYIDDNLDEIFGITDADNASEEEEEEEEEVSSKHFPSHASKQQCKQPPTKFRPSYGKLGMKPKATLRRKKGDTCVSSCH